MLRAAQVQQEAAAAPPPPEVKSFDEYSKHDKGKVRGGSKGMGRSEPRGRESGAGPSAAGACVFRLLAACIHGYARPPAGLVQNHACML